MNLCSNGHEEVCYESRRCPACELLEENKTLEADIEELNTTILELEAGK